MIQKYVVSLFFVLNAIGNIPLFLAILAPFPLKRQRIIILREFFIAFIILLIFNFFGEHALTLIGIAPPIIGIAGGAVLFIIAIMMIFPHENKRQIGSKTEPMIVPLATPITAGPGTITAVMIFSHQASSPFIITGAIAIALAVSLIIILLASNIKRLLGEKGLIAVERLGGLILALIGVQMIMSGLTKFIQFEFFHIPYIG